MPHAAPTKARSVEPLQLSAARAGCTSGRLASDFIISQQLESIKVVAIINPINPGCSDFARSWLVLIRPVTKTSCKHWIHTGSR